MDIDFHIVEPNEDVFDWIEENLVGSEFIVCSEQSRDDLVEDYIKGSAWAFKASFILNHSRTSLDEESLIRIQEKQCEDANDFVLELIDNIDSFIEDAVSSDGYGHFLANYDGDETELEIDGIRYYIYRQN